MPPRYHQTSITLALNGHQHWWIYGIQPIFFQSTSTFVFIKSLFHKSRHQLKPFVLVCKENFLFLVSGPSPGSTLASVHRGNLASGKLTKLSCRDWSSARRSHCSTWSTCPGGWSPVTPDAYGISNPQGIWKNPNTCLWDFVKIRVGHTYVILLPLFWINFFHRSTYKACWNQEETLHERVNTLTDRFASSFPAASMHVYILISYRNKYIYIYLYRYFLYQYHILAYTCI